MEKENLKEVFDGFKGQYEKILKDIYPSLKSTGFSERNLSVNFSKAYEKIYENAVSWFEFQATGENGNNNNHIDSVIVNYQKGELLIVESKRFSNTSDKLLEIEKDIGRIEKLYEELKTENRIDLNKINIVKGVILADVWLETDPKKEIFSYYSNLEKDLGEIISSVRNLNNLQKFYQDIDSSKNSNTLEKYKLVSFVWDLV